MDICDFNGKRKALAEQVDGKSRRCFSSNPTMTHYKTSLFNRDFTTLLAATDLGGGVSQSLHLLISVRVLSFDLPRSKIQQMRPDVKLVKLVEIKQDIATLIWFWVFKEL